MNEQYDTRTDAREAAEIMSHRHAQMHDRTVDGQIHESDYDDGRVKFWWMESDGESFQCIWVPGERAGTFSAAP